MHGLEREDVANLSDYLDLRVLHIPFVPRFGFWEQCNPILNIRYQGFYSQNVHVSDDNVS